MANARAKAEQADSAGDRAQQDCDVARLKAKEYAPEFHQPGTDVLKKQLENNEQDYDFSNVAPMQNHNPHRSKSMATHPDTMDSGAIPMMANLASAYQQHNSTTPRQPNDISITGYGSNTPGNPQMQDNMDAIRVNQHNRSPSLKVRRYSFLAGSRRGRGFSEIFNSTILNDHFDQYSALRDDSGLGKDIYTNNDRSRSGPSDTSPDSGVSDSLDEDSKNRPLQRRRTLPCIVNGPEENIKMELAEQETAHSSENLAGKNPTCYIIENGIRKRVRAEVHQNPSRSRGELPNEYKIESQNQLGATNARGSLPDLKVVNQRPMGREEVYRLGMARRGEVRRLQDLAERRRQGDVGVILGDLKDWCQERQLLVLVIAINLSLATMFFNLLS